MPPLPIWIICSESHYSVLFSTDAACPTKKQFDVVYYDELARQEDDIILTVTPGTHKPKAGKDKEYTVPIDCVLRTRWDKAGINWNGRTVIL
jgi:ubiquitin carboxyl-terminal hydrolase MINDY-3/4